MVNLMLRLNNLNENEYYNSEDLKKFTSITDWNKELGDKFLTTMKTFLLKENRLLERSL